MNLYLSSSIVLDAFNRLAEITPEPKAGQEVTSAILYLLSFERTRAQLGCDEILDFAPDTESGMRSRSIMRQNFAALSTLCSHKTPGLFVHVVDLGCYTCDRKSPDKRIGSNFFTVPLKKASQSERPLDYPNRKHGPLLVLGPLNRPSRWCIARHDKWVSNLRQMLAERRSSTPFTDLAIFILRNAAFGAAESLTKSLTRGLDGMFCKDFSAALRGLVADEKPSLRAGDKVFVSEYKNAFTGFAANSPSALDRSDPRALQARIAYLEQVLSTHRIPHN